MTGLERVRDYIGKYAPNPTKAMHVLEDLDAHEKEDAEKAADALAVEGQLHEKWTELEAEVSKWKMRCLTRDGECIKLSVELGGLREELDLKDGLLNQAKGELDRLREKLEYAQGGQYVAVMQENARLREAIEDYFEHDDVRPLYDVYQEKKP